jgi:hypothetical protein
VDQLYVVTQGYAPRTTGAFGVVVRPVKELRGFHKLALQPASEAHVENFLQDQPMIKFPAIRRAGLLSCGYARYYKISARRSSPSTSRCSVDEAYSDGQTPA